MFPLAKILAPLGKKLQKVIFAYQKSIFALPNKNQHFV